MSIKLVAIDIGGVLTNIDKSPIFKLDLRHQKNLSTIFDQDFNDLQKGNITASLFFALKSEKLGLDKFLLINAFTSMIKAVDHGEILNKIKTEYFFMSNINEIHFETFLKQVHVSQYSLENSLLSFKIHSLKPEQSFFEHYPIKNYMPLEQVLFIDDKAKNISSALNFGFKAALCLNPSKLKKILCQYDLI